MALDDATLESAAPDAHAIGQGLRVDADGSERFRHGCNPVALLDAQFRRARHDRLAPSDRGGGKQHRKFVDGACDQFARHHNAAQWAGVDFQVCDRLATAFTL
jgi:hypothetical protein